MERDVRYIAVGIVVSILVAGIIGFLVWEAQRQVITGGERYTIEFTSPVTGISIASPVRYLGVSVGRVDALQLSEVDRVEVIISVNPETPINASTIARVEPEGITGRSYITLVTPEPDAGPVAVPPGADIPVIPSQPSSLDRLFSGMPELVAQFAEVSQGLVELLGPENRADFSRTLSNLAGSTDHLETLVTGANELIVSFDKLAGRAGTAMDTADVTMQDARQALPELERALANLADLSERLTKLVAGGEGPVERLSRETLPELDKLMGDARHALVAIETLARKLEQDPSLLIYRHPDGGVEIPP